MLRDPHGPWFPCDLTLIFLLKSVIFKAAFPCSIPISKYIRFALLGTFFTKGQAQAQPRTLNRGVCRPPVWGGHGFPSAIQLPGLQFSIHPITGSLARGKLPLTQVQTVH